MRRFYSESNKTGSSAKVADGLEGAGLSVEDIDLFREVREAFKTNKGKFIFNKGGKGADPKRPPKAPPNKNKKKDKSHTQCYSCKEYGHCANECPKRPSAHQGNGQPGEDEDRFEELDEEGGGVVMWIPTPLLLFPWILYLRPRYYLRRKERRAITPVRDPFGIGPLINLVRIIGCSGFIFRIIIRIGYFLDENLFGIIRAALASEHWLPRILPLSCNPMQLIVKVSMVVLLRTQVATLRLLVKSLWVILLKLARSMDYHGNRILTDLGPGSVWVEGSFLSPQALSRFLH